VVELEGDLSPDGPEDRILDGFRELGDVLGWPAETEPSPRA